ncbi:uncharacterized protein H6S33_007980 [Morchella sextelata]|uniref:uncharacterized protein n=1 Tax=Morchella sextelata TaxID=1174677 RepID=UPI001D04B32F|nr:uncharacterized protein H6S33_007980 [Morchella sextelata]KAH0602976.1 hypothetical protein H6S33_007980 [Morchella sextelata]
MPYSNRAHHSRAPRPSARSITRPGAAAPDLQDFPPLPRSTRSSLTANLMSINRLLSPRDAPAPGRPLTRRALHELQETFVAPRIPAVEQQPQYIIPIIHRDASDTDARPNPFMPPHRSLFEFTARTLPIPLPNPRRDESWQRASYFPSPYARGPSNRRADIAFRVYRDAAASTTAMDLRTESDGASQADTVSNHSNGTLPTLPDANGNPVFATHAEASLYASDASDCGADDAAACQVCTRRRAIVRFVKCTHGLCVACMKGTWWGRINRERHWPTVLPCGLCRAEVDRVRVLEGGVLGRVQGVLEFMVERSGTVRVKLRWEEIDRVRPVELQPWLIFKHRQVFMQHLFPTAEGQPPAQGSDSLGIAQ